MYLTFYHDIEKKSIGSERFDKKITIYIGKNILISQLNI